MLKQNTQVAKVSAEVDEVAALRSDLTAHHCVHIGFVEKLSRGSEFDQISSREDPIQFSSAQQVKSLKAFRSKETGDSGRPRD